MARKAVITTIDTVLIEVTRWTNTQMGNPRYFVHTEAGRFGTEADAQIGYSLTNVTDRAVGHRVRLYLSDAHVARGGVTGIQDLDTGATAGDVRG